MRSVTPTEPAPAKHSLYDAFASVGKAMGSGRRLELLDVLAQGERPVEELAHETSLPVANASHHLRTLAAAGLVRTRRSGTHIYYRLAAPEVADLLAAVRSVASTNLAEVEGLAGAYLGDRTDLEVIGREELSRRLRSGEVTLVDVRPPREYEAGHIPGARCVAPSDADRELRRIPKNAEVVAYCRGPFCAFADEAVRLLRRRGVRAMRLEDGFPEWSRAGLPVAVGREAGGSA